MSRGHVVVVGIDVGGSKTNATVVDLTGAFLVDRMARRAEPGRATGPTPHSTPSSRRWRRGPRRRWRARRRRARGRSRHAGPGQRHGGDLVEGLDQLPATGLARLRHPLRRPSPASACPCSTTTTATPPRCMPTSTSSVPTRHTARRSPPSSARDSAVASSSAARSCAGHREWPASSATCTIPHGRPARARPAPAAVQLRSGRRPRVGRLAERNRTQSAAVLAEPLPRPPPRRAGRPVARARRPARFAAMAKAATSWRCGSSPSRRRRSGGCSRSPPTTPTPTPTSWAEVSSSRAPRSATGSSRRSARPPPCARSNGAVAQFAVVADLDMAGARGSALAALRAIHPSGTRRLTEPTELCAS